MVALPGIWEVHFVRTVHFMKATECTNMDRAASLTRKNDESLMTNTTSLPSFTLVCSQPSSLAVHITLPDSRGERKEG